VTFIWSKTLLQCAINHANQSKHFTGATRKQSNNSTLLCVGHPTHVANIFINQ